MSKKIKNVFIEAGGFDYKLMFITLGYTVVPEPEEADLIVFTGGADVSPHMYGDKAHPATFNHTYRDAKEERLFAFAKEKDIPCVGICRGGQFLNVMSGGRMYQDVTKHTAPHYITDHFTGEVIYVSSTHHQMMMPGGDAQVVATSNLKGNREWYDLEIFRKDVADEDYEVLFYERTKCLCFQPHPEFTGVPYEGMTSYFKSLIDRYLEN